MVCWLAWQRCTQVTYYEEWRKGDVSEDRAGIYSKVEYEYRWRDSILMKIAVVFVVPEHKKNKIWGNSRETR